LRWLFFGCKKIERGREEEKIRRENPEDKKQKWKPGLRFHCDFAFDAVFTKPQLQ
jgi:hypothetical protein